MITPKFTITANATRLFVHLDALPIALKRTLHDTIAALTRTLHTQVRAAEPRRTGYLRSQTRAYVDERDNWIRGRVRIRPTGRASRAGAYFGALEYGVPRQRVSVRSYRRQGGTVREYTRSFYLAERRFLRGPGARMLARARTEIQAAITKAVTETQRK